MQYRPKGNEINAFPLQHRLKLEIEEPGLAEPGGGYAEKIVTAHYGVPGDYLVISPVGWVSLVKKEDFERKYEPAS